MKQIVQNVSGGAVSVREVPAPTAPANGVVVGVLASLISAGTERYVIELAQKSMLGKARQRPDQVRRVIEKIQSEGLKSTVQQVRAKLDEPMALGYSAAGVVLECGRNVSEFKPGDRVAVAAPHAGIVAVGRRLCAAIPDGVSFEDAAYAGVGAVALQGVRLAEVQLGTSVVVVGLGLIGLMTVALLKAQGCRVLGCDVQASRLDQAAAFGADAVMVGLDRDRVAAFTENAGADAVVITAATSSNEPIEFAADACRTRGRIVLVGVAGLNIPRPPFFQKELEFTVSSSLGAGRGDATYEEKGHDYPIGHARWTVQRNMRAVLDTIASGALPVRKLTSHTFEIESAGQAYAMMASGSEPYTGIVLKYPEPERVDRRLPLHDAVPAPGQIGASLIGAGNFARLVLLPAMATQGLQLRGVATTTGLHAEHSGRRYGFAFATTETKQLFDDAATSAVFVATRHDRHAELVVRSLEAGKHVFVEKPLCLTSAELEEIDRVVRRLGASCPIVMVGFNRRYTRAAAALAAHFDGVAPRSVLYRFMPGALPDEAWPHDMESGGGRLLGEACHAIDLCASLAGSVPVRVFAESTARRDQATTTDDRVTITMRHENGSTSAIAYQAGGDRSGPGERIEMFGGGRTGVIDEWKQLQLWKAGRRSSSAISDKGHRDEIAAFARAVRSGGAWPVPWRETYAVTWATLAALESLRLGGPVEIGQDF